MITQQFCPFSRILGRFAGFFTLALALVLTIGCDILDEPNRGTPAREPSTACDPPCSSENFGCFIDDVPCDDPPCVGCYERTCPPENPIQSCAPGAICNGQVCVFESVCDPDCPTNTHCVSGSCIPNYTPENICDPLIVCRNQCRNTYSGCLAACEEDRSPWCRDCTRTMAQCEARESCTASATGCCSDEYCSCFPGSPSCGGGPACASCFTQCGGDDLNFECFKVCAEAQTACSVCLDPWNQCNASGGDCDHLFWACID